MTPTTFESVEGFVRTVDAPSPQTLDDTPYEFSSWNNDGTAIQTFPTPTDDTTIVAYYSIIVGTEKAVEGSPVILMSNPARNGYVDLMIISHREQSVSITLTDAHTYQSRRTTWILKTGDNYIKIPAGNLSDGLYAISIETSEKRSMKKVLLIK